MMTSPKMTGVKSGMGLIGPAIVNGCLLLALGALADRVDGLDAIR